MDGYGQRFALIEGFFGEGEADDDGGLLGGSGEELGFGRERRLGTFLERGKKLVIAVEIDGGGGLVFVGVAVGGGELRLEAANPERFFGRVVERERDGDEERMLSGDFGGGDEIDGAGALGLGALVESDDADDEGDGGDADYDDANGWEITFGGAEFIADVEVGGSGLGWIGRRGRERRRVCGHGFDCRFRWGIGEGEG